MKDNLYGEWEYKGNKYTAYNSLGLKLKDPTTGEWVDAVEYRPLETWVCKETGEEEIRQSWNTMYVRERSDFLAKFKRCEVEIDETLPD